MLKLKQVKMNDMEILVEQPTKKLTWTTEDYEKGRKWALTQPHPYLKGQTLWEHVYDSRESVYTIDNINKYLFSEM